MHETVRGILPVHPLAHILPEITPLEFDALARSIAETGQLVSAMSWEAPDGIEYLIDGRHRARACEQLGIPLIVELFEGSEMDVAAYVLATNVMRRHLSPSQRAAAASALATRRRGQRGSAAGFTQEQAAETAGVSIRLVRSARSFAKDPVLTRAVLDGALTVTEAERAVRSGDAKALSAQQLAQSRESATDEWLTPWWLLERVEKVLERIDGDVCAEPGRRVPAAWHITEDDDALKRHWSNPDGSPSRLFMNPPWSGAAMFTRRLLAEFDAGRVEQAIVLIPARLGSEYVAALTDRGFPRVELTGRLVFEPGRGATPSARGESHFSSMLIGVGISPASMKQAFGDVGVTLTVWQP